MNRAERRRQKKQTKKKTHGRAGSAPDPARARESFDKAMAFHRSGRLEEAIRWYGKSLENMPENPGALVNRGAAHQALGRWAEAAADSRGAIALNPNFPEAHNNLGNALREQGDLEGAAASFEKAIAAKPAYPEAHFNLGNLRQAQGRVDAALTSYDRAISLNPHYVEAHCNRGNLLGARGRLEEALASYDQALAVNPNHPEAHGNRGIALQESGRLEEAAASYEKAITLQPRYVHAHYNLGNTLKALGRLEEAVASYGHAVALAPGFAEAHCNLGDTLLDLERLEEAAACFDQALTLKPDYPEAHNNRGNLLKEQGSLKEAAACYRRALAVQPTFHKARFNLAQAEKCADPGEIEAMEAFLEEEMPLEDRIDLYFALGKALADMGRDGEAFDHYRDGNLLKRSAYDYDIAADERFFAFLRESFNAGFFAERQGWGLDDPTPIFIVGMPRSGTTLIEQILASHPDVHGAGELPFLFQIVEEKLGADPAAAIDALTAADAEALGRDYLERVRKLAPDAGFITDKMPANCLYLGLIRLMLPQARIIHATRSAEDTCLSIFRTKFTGKHDYAYDLTELGRYYRLYRQLMTHWKGVLPGAVHDVSYEALTGNQEEETRRLLAICGLDWNDACLDFHQTARPVKTASAAQVREPIYRSSVGGWKRFEEELAPLVGALGGRAKP